MYCVILYGAPPERYLSAPSQLPSSQKSSQRGVRKPDKMLYVNPDCALQILIDYITKELKLEPWDEIDFCNLNGDLLHIEESEPAVNATSLFIPYEKYVCVLKQKNDEGVLTKLTPLVTNIYSEVSLKLRKYVKASKRFSYDLKLRSDKENAFITNNSSRLQSRSAYVRKSRRSTKS